MKKASAKEEAKVEAVPESAEAVVLKRLREQQHRVLAAEEDHENAKQLAAEAKKDLDTQVSVLIEMVGRTEHQGDLLDTLPDPADDEAWRKTPLADVIPFGYIVKHLEEAHILTMGHLADYTQTGQRVIDLNGIGPAAAEKIDKATEQFWKDRKEAKPEPEPTEVITCPECGHANTRILGAAEYKCAGCGETFYDDAPDP